ncbi:MAG: hypothetical protein KatS3mg056_2384 [Chloroflexus sp.]|nr:MAG: hypothetical protein KatS3mg056_2384 [Chloroflexus sp.]
MNAPTPARPRFSLSYFLSPTFSLLLSLSYFLSLTFSLLLSLSYFLSPTFSLLLSLSYFLSPIFSLLFSLSYFLSPIFSLLFSLSYFLSPIFSLLFSIGGGRMPPPPPPTPPPSGESLHNSSPRRGISPQLLPPAYALPITGVNHVRIGWYDRYWCCCGRPASVTVRRSSRAGTCWMDCLTRSSCACRSGLECGSHAAAPAVLTIRCVADGYPSWSRRYWMCS